MSLDDDDAELVEEAWNYLQKYMEAEGNDVGAHELAQRRATVAMALGYSDRTLRVWLSERERPPSSKEAKNNLIRVYRHVSKIIDPDWYLASAVSQMLDKEAGQFSVLKRYFGQYRSLIYDEGELVEVNMSIDDSNGHKPVMLAVEDAVQRGRASSRINGPLFEVGGRAHCIAAGMNRFGRYVNVVSIVLNENISENPLFGVMTKEVKGTRVPFATPIALFHESFDWDTYPAAFDATKSLMANSTSVQSVEVLSYEEYWSNI